MTRWTWFLVGSSVITAVTVLFAVLTTRTIRARQATVSPAYWDDPQRLLELSRGSLYLNAAASQGVMLAALVGVIVVTGVEMVTFNLPGAIALTQAIALGVGLGLVLAVGNLGMQATLDRQGVTYDDSLRALLSPDSLLEWIVLLGVVLPIVAGFEELLFRGALIGAIQAGFGVSPWLLAVLSSIVFAAGHGLQGRGGLFAAGMLGIILAVAFILTESLVVVIVAHYVINAVEFARS